MISELALIKQHLDKIRKKELREFFQVCFSSTVRIVSGTRKGEFKLYRMKPEKWKNYNPNVFEIFENKVNEAISKMGEFFDFIQSNGLNAKVDIFEADTNKLLTKDFPKGGRKRLREESVDLIVTSPPYGDSQTTVAYGQFSKYSLIWLGYNKDEVLQIDKKSLGGRKNDKELNSRKLEEILEKIPDKKRAQEVKSFFVDLDNCLEKLVQVLRTVVLGNRTVNKVKIPTDEILIVLGKGYGLNLETIIYRNIPSKRIPWKSSPTNIPGKKVETISRESIVILKK